jgi:hypothetical protein
MNNRLCAVLLIALGLFAVPLAAEQLPDPTRPAIELVPGLSEGAASQAPPPQGLQSVIISRKREAAIINGIEVERGDKFGDAVLTDVNETCVVLMGPEGRRVMHMFPTVKMTKNQMACVKRQAMRPISKTIYKPAKKNKAKKKVKAKTKKRAVVCVPVEEFKDGSGK